MEELGRIATVDISINGGGSWVPVGEAKDISFPLARDTHDATSNDDDLWKVFVKGHKQLTLSFTCNYDSSDVGQDNIIQAEYDDTDIMYRYRPRGNIVGQKEYISAYNITAVDLTTPTQGLSELSVTAEGTGTPARQNIT